MSSKASARCHHRLRNNLSKIGTVIVFGLIVMISQFLKILKSYGNKRINNIVRIREVVSILVFHMA